MLRIEALTVSDGNGVARVKEASFALHRGEIVGIAGVAGNGQSELLEALAGMRPVSGGRILLRGRPLEPGAGGIVPRVMRRLGLAHVPEDRSRMGLVYPFHAWESGILGYHDDTKFNGSVLMDRAAAAGRCGEAMRRFDVRPASPQLRTGAFSGGNQQKIVLARELGRDPDVLLVGQPTRGVDIGAIEFIHRQILGMRAAGKAILLVSVELDEILSLSDRILVMFDGRIVGSFACGEATERRLGLLMAGVEEPA
jgi:simple sugar transport system ATP-binding protein